jgi:predicted PurR-regulated permease PerM
MTTADRPKVPSWLVTLSEWAWRLLLIGAVAVVVLYIAAQLSFLLGSIVVAAMGCALLEPIRSTIRRNGGGPTVAWVSAFFVGVLFLFGVVALAVTEFYDNYDELAVQTTEGVSQVTDWLRGPPLKIKVSGVDDAVSRALGTVKDSPTTALSGTLSVLSTTGGLLASALLTFVTTFFLMKDRARIWSAFLNIVPSDGRDVVDRSGRAAWQVLVGYVQVTLISALVDSTAIGVTAAIVGVPVAFALAILVFLFAFIPTVGAIISGAATVLIALVAQGPTAALVLAIVVLVVQQLDANVMYPFLASRRLSVHPLASILLVAGGGVVGGIFGAFLAVPVAAMLIAVVQEIRTDSYDATHG